MAKDVILVTVDSWRADHCGFMGYEKDVSPTLDEMAKDGLVFKNAIAPAPSTSGSVPAFFTGEYANPSLQSTGDDYAEIVDHHLRTRQTVPQLFQEMGYETGAFTANPWTSRYFGFDQLFDSFTDFMDDKLASEQGSDSTQNSVIRELFSQMRNWYRGQDMFMSWEAFYSEIRSWIADVDGPYFLWIFLVDVHMPYLPGSGYRSRSRLRTYPANASLYTGNDRLQSVFHDTLIETYDDTIRYTDEFFRRLSADLTSFDSEPLIVVHADHGEEFGEKGVYGHGPHVSEAMLHVPLVVVNGPSGEIDRPVSLRQFPSLLPALARGENIDDQSDNPIVWARNYDPAVLVRGTNWRYVWRPERETVSVRSSSGWESTDNSALLQIGRQSKNSHIAGERERKRIRNAAQTVVETCTV